MYESQGLYPLDSSLPEDDWPLLELSDAVVYEYKQGSPERLVDVLQLSEHGPLRVKGRLQPSHSANIKDPAIYNSALVIPKVYTYSIENFEDGTLKIWILGQAAWYGLSPAKEYRKLFETAVKKARLWTFVEDVYSDRKARSTPMEKLYEMYAKEEESGCTLVIQAKKLVEKHRLFLIVKMIEQGKWEKTAIWKHMLKEYAQEIVEIRMALEARQKRYMNRKNDIDEEAEVETKVKVKRESDVHMVVRGKSKSRPIYLFLEDYLCSRFGMQNVDATLEVLVRLFYQHYELENMQKSHDILAARASELCALMAGSTRYQWKRKTVFRELSTIPLPPNAELLVKERLIQRSAPLDMSEETLTYRSHVRDHSVVSSPRYSSSLNIQNSRNSSSSTSTSSSAPKKNIKTSAVAARSMPTSNSTLVIRTSPRSKPTATMHRLAYMKGASIKKQPAAAPVLVKRELLSSSPPYLEPSPAPSSAPSFRQPTATSKGKSTLRPIGQSTTTQSSPLCTPSLTPSPPPLSTAARLATLKRKLDSNLSLSHLTTKRPRLSSASTIPSYTTSPTPSPLPYDSQPRFITGALLPTEADEAGIWRCRLRGCGKVVFGADLPGGMAEVEEHYREHGRRLGDVMDVIGREAKRKKGGDGGFGFLLEKLEGMVDQCANGMHVKVETDVKVENVDGGMWGVLN